MLHARNIQTGTKIRMTTDFSSEIMQVRKEQNDIFKVLRGKNLST